MDRAMRKEIGKPIRKAEKVLKKAEKSTTKLAHKDQVERDPKIKAYEKMKKKGC